MSVVADGVIVDEKSHLASIFNIAENINAAGFPVMVQHLTFMCIWEYEEPAPRQVTGTLTVEQGDRIFIRQNVSIDFRVNDRMRTIMNVQGLTFDRPGRVTFKVTIPDQATGTYDIMITPMAPQAAVNDPG